MRTVIFCDSDRFPTVLTTIAPCRAFMAASAVALSAKAQNPKPRDDPPLLLRSIWPQTGLDAALVTIKSLSLASSKESGMPPTRSTICPAAVAILSE